MTWLDVGDDAPFDAWTLPYGVFSTDGQEPRVGVAVGSWVLDLSPVAGAELFDRPSLNPFLAAGRPTWDAVRARLLSLVGDPRHQTVVEAHLVPLRDVVLHLPFEVADYVDFYASQTHAENVGQLFRPDSPALPAAWKHLPIGYHGRAGTVVVSGTPIVRPSGLRRVGGPGGAVEFGPSLRLDIEAEAGFVVGTPSALGSRVPVGAFEDHVFGMVLVNDWSARDVQAFEYVPLGPFLGKSFATSVSPWVVPLAALAHARVSPPPRSPAVAGYLRDEEPWGLDVEFEVVWNGTVVSRPPLRDLYWTPAQQLAHLTVNGASLRTGDLYASGTVSGPRPGGSGCFLELTWNGAEPVTLADGSQRSFLEDGDLVTIRATAPGPSGRRMKLGEVTGTVTPSR
ncbi:fumarylacetoacetase [Jiangella rhizosphaerae]|uniref:fumarylacetoacetase n=1 Tax=Jiangella rhizosphaerae TaxID=2293569 RepID=A0A418KR61_9ACTN|nr:fumarylacetoacetase [Jiangella rhizosphaerae]RIQ22875.1 fumarylacetoacetase [Jiangella rhizosphaerae]